MRRLTCVIVGLATGLAAAPAYAGDGTFTQAGAPVPVQFPLELAVGDFNRDGDPDLAVTTLNNTVVPVIGGPGGSFTIGTALAAVGFGTSGIVLGDFNNDDDDDLAVPTFCCGNPSKLNIFTGGTNAGFSGPATHDVQNPTGIAIGYVDNDLDEDLLLSEDPLDPDRRTLRGAVGATFTDAGTVAIDSPFGDPNAIALTEPNGIVVADGNSHNLFITNVDHAPTGNDPEAIAVGDFNGDGRDDVAVANEGSDNVSILEAQSPAPTFIASSLLPVGASPRSVAVGEFNSDGDEDLAVTSASGVSTFLGGPGVSFTAGQTLPVDGFSNGVAIADFNADGIQDLAATAGSFDRITGIHILLGNGTSWNSGNLLQFAGIEGIRANGESTPVAPAPWHGTGGFLRYGSPYGPSLLTAQRWEGGLNFFYGGFSVGNTFLTQIVDVTPFAAQIDAGQITAKLSALLGGVRSDTDTMTVSAIFVDGGGVSRGLIGPPTVTATDRRIRTVLMPRSAADVVPAGTRSIEVTLEAHKDGSGDFTTNALADNVKLSLQAAAAGAPAPDDAPPLVPPAGFGADTTDPETTIDKGPEAKTKSKKAKIVYSANEPATFECKLKGASKQLREFGPCDAAKTEYKRLDPGKKKFSVRAIDAYGNVDETPAELKWRVLSG